MTTKPRITPAARQFVEDDYQDNVWSNGDEPIDSVHVIAGYWDEFVHDCKTWGRSVPKSLTPEIYCHVWMEIYNRRTAGNMTHDILSR